MEGDSAEPAELQILYYNDSFYGIDPGQPVRYVP
jgi:hypothetical protein